MSERIFNRAALIPGLNVSRRARAPISKAIVIGTGIRTEPLWKMSFMGVGRYFDTVRGLSHDAKFVVDPKDGELKIGDALGGETNECVYTPIEEWERGCVENGDRVIVGRPFGATDRQLEAGAAAWVRDVAGKKYDKVALAQLALKIAFGDWISYRVGLYSRFFCTEGVAHADEVGTKVNAYWPNKNPTPGTTTRRYLSGRIVEEVCALTEFGLRHRAVLK